MKQLVLTEQQFKNIKQYYILESYMGQIDESINFSLLWQKYKKAILAGITSTAIIASINNLNVNQNIKNELLNLAQEELLNKQQDSVYNEKVKAVESYMATAIKNQGFNPQNLQLSAEEMVNACQEYDYDLPLLLAQAHLESCFGFGNRARKTGSVFSVGCYDNGKNRVKYANQNDSIRPYIKIMQNDYLHGGKTVDNLLSPKSFVNKLGKRYAQDKNYENKVKSIRNKIIRKYPVLLQN